MTPTPRSNTTPNVLTELGPDDVLLGRGTGPNEHAGNIQYRAIVRDIIHNSGLRVFDGKAKAKLATEVINEVKSRGGRFLQKLHTPDATGERFVEVPDTVAHDKTKQSFRHQLRGILPQKPRQRISNIPKSILNSGEASSEPQDANPDTSLMARNLSEELLRLKQQSVPPALLTSPLVNTPATSTLTGLTDPAMVAMKSELASLYLAESLLSREKLLLSQLTQDVSPLAASGLAAAPVGLLGVPTLPLSLRQPPALPPSVSSVTACSTPKNILEAVLNEVRQLR